MQRDDEERWFWKLFTKELLWCPELLVYPQLPPEGEPDETGYQEGILTADYNFITGVRANGHDHISYS